MAIQEKEQGIGLDQTKLTPTGSNSVVSVHDDKSCVSTVSSKRPFVGTGIFMPGGSSYRQTDYMYIMIWSVAYYYGYR